MYFVVVVIIMDLLLLKFISKRTNNSYARDCRCYHSNNVAWTLDTLRNSRKVTTVTSITLISYSTRIDRTRSCREGF